MLTRPLLRTFAAAAEAVWPAAGPVGAGVDVPALLAEVWDDLTDPARRNLAAMLVALDVAAVARTGRRLHRLPAARRTALCDALEHGGGAVGRSAFLGVKTLVLVLAGSDSGVQRALGTAGWPPGQPR